MTEHVLPVLAAHDHHVPAGRVGDDGGREVGAARVVVAPLRREQIDDGHALGPRLEQRRGRRDEVDVAVDRDPVGAGGAVDGLERQNERGAAAAPSPSPPMSSDRVSGR